MDKKEFLKALFIVGLLNTFLTTGIVCLVYFIIIVATTAPFILLAILLFIVIGYSSAFIYLKLKGKE